MYATLEEWIPIALANNIGDYDEFSDREVSYEGPISIDREYIGYSYLYLLTIAEATHFLSYER